MTTAKKMQSRVIKIGRVDINVPSSQTLLARNGASNNFSFKQRGEDNSLFAKKHHHVYAPLKQFLSLSAV